MDNCKNTDNDKKNTGNVDIKSLNKSKQAKKKIIDNNETVNKK